MKVDPAIVNIIESGRSEGNLYFLPDYQLDRKVYQNVNKVLTALGGKWNRKEKAHVFNGDITDAIDSVILTGEVVDLKAHFQFFETPSSLARKLVNMAEIEPDMMCLEPSAGRGRIAEQLRLIVGRGKTICIDIHSPNVKYLQEQEFRVAMVDFMKTQPKPNFDRIVMNPPFSRQQDIDHVTHAIRFLKPKGILVSVMSCGVRFRQNKKTREFLELLDNHSVTFEDLPDGAFKESGTMVHAVVLKLVKA